MSHLTILTSASCVALAFVMPADAQSRGRAPGTDGGRKAAADTIADGAPTRLASARVPAREATPGVPSSATFYRAQREIPLGAHWGLGYDLNVRFSLRERRVYREDLDTGRELFNQLAFVRYGVKGAVGRPYVRVGMLDTARLGYGQVLSYYDNTPLGVPGAKRGMEAGMNFGRAGFEFLTGNLLRLEVMAGRLYFRPFAASRSGRLGGLQLGVSSATDFAPGAGYILESIPQAARVRSGSVDGQRYPRPTMLGADVTLPLLRRDGSELLGWLDVARLREGGHGGVFALQLTQQVRHSRVILKYEHREVSDGFRPGYFDGSYEQQRFSLSEGKVPGEWTVGTRYRATLASVSGGPAAWLEMRALMPNLMVWSFYVRQYENSKSGWLHLEGDTRTVIPRVSLHGWYDKWNIDGTGDLFALDDRSSLQGAAAFRLVRNINVLALRRWTYTPWVDAAGNRRYARQRLAEHRITLRVPF